MKRFAGAFFLTGAFMLAGTSVIAGRVVSDTLGSFTITAVSLFFALVGLLPVCGRGLSKILPGLSAGDWVRLLFQAVFGIFLFRIFLLQGLIRTSAGEAGILTGATPAATALLAWLVLKEKLHAMRFLGIVSTVIGILAIQGIFSAGFEFSREHFDGNMLVLGAAICESLFNILSRISTKISSPAHALDPIMQTTFVVIIALLLCLGPAFAEHMTASLVLLDISGWIALVWYGLFTTALAYIFWYSGIKRCEASVAAAFSGMMPVTSLALAVLLLNEQPGVMQWIGGGLVVLGMLLTGLKVKQNIAEDHMAG